MHISRGQIFYNPFIYIAGWRSLVVGLAVVLLTAWICFISGTHNYGLLNINFAGDTIFLVYLTEHVTHWMVGALLLYGSGVLLSKSKIRFVDVLGTQGIARFPLLILPLVRLFPTFKSFLVNSAPMYFLFVLHIAMAIWSVALMFNAYKICCNVKGTRLVISYIVSLLLAEIISRILIYLFSTL